jgi:hypothetical protein
MGSGTIDSLGMGVDNPGIRFSRSHFDACGLALRPFHLNRAVAQLK